MQHSEKAGTAHLPTQFSEPSSTDSDKLQRRDTELKICNHENVVSSACVHASCQRQQPCLCHRGVIDGNLEQRHDLLPLAAASRFKRLGTTNVSGKSTG
jgi:hypothetical protein